MLEEVVDMKRFIMGSHGKERCIEKINYIIFQHKFRIKTIDWKTPSWAKKYSKSAEWEHASGLTFLKFIPICQIYASKLLLLQSDV